MQTKLRIYNLWLNSVWYWISQTSLGLWIFGGTSVCHSLAALREASETARTKQHESWESELNGTHETQMHSMWPLNSWMWENPFPFKCFFLPIPVMDRKVSTSIRKLFGSIMIKEKAKHFIEFSQSLCAKCILHYSSVRVSHKVNTLRI